MAGISSISRDRTGPKPQGNSDSWRPEAEAAEVDKTAIVEALDCLSFGIIFVDADARALLINRAASEIIDVGSGLTLRNGGLEATSAGETQRLRRLILEAAAHEGTVPSSSSVFAMPVSRSGDQRPLSVIIASLRASRSRSGSTQSAAVIFVSNPDLSDKVPGSLVRSLFGLTTSEAILTAGVLEGKGLELAAQRSSMKLNTARSHLKKVFGKTGTRRQAELLRLFLKAVGFVRFD